MKTFFKIAIVLSLFTIAIPLFSQVTIKGKAYADYYYNYQNNNQEFATQHGFWFRRARLTFEHKATDILKTRVRLEMSSKGDFSSDDKYAPILKDAYMELKFSGIGKDKLRIGIMETLTKKQTEKNWGYRAMEKTPTDLYKIRSSRDFAIQYSGKKSMFDYAVMYGNHAGTKFEINKTKQFSLSLGVEPIENFYIQGYFDKELRDENISMIKGLVAYSVDDLGRVGVEYAMIKDETTNDNTMLSAFLVGKLPYDFDFIMRYDNFTNTLAKANDIAYTPLQKMSEDGSTSAFLAGLAYNGIENVSIIPYCGIFSYGGDAIKLDENNLETISIKKDDLESDIYMRITFEFRY